MTARIVEHTTLRSLVTDREGVCVCVYVCVLLYSLPLVWSCCVADGVQVLIILLCSDEYLASLCF